MALGQFPFIWEANFAPPCHPCLPPPACSAFPCVQHGPSLAETSFPAMVTKVSVLLWEGQFGGATYLKFTEKFTMLTGLGDRRLGRHALHSQRDNGRGIRRQRGEGLGQSLCWGYLNESVVNLILDPLYMMSCFSSLLLPRFLLCLCLSVVWLWCIYMWIFLSSYCLEFFKLLIYQISFFIKLRKFMDIISSFFSPPSLLLGGISQYHGLCSVLILFPFCSRIG